MTYQTRLNTDGAQTANTEQTATQKAFMHMAVRTNFQVMRVRAWNNIFGTSEYFSSDEQIVDGLTGYLMQWLGKDVSPYTWLSREEAFSLVKSIIRDPLKTVDGEAKALTDAKIDDLLSGAQQRGFIEIMRVDQRDKRFKWYRLAEKTLLKHMEFQRACDSIEKVVKTQIADPKNPTAGLHLLDNPTVYHNVLDPSRVVPEARETPFTTDTKTGETVVKKDGKILPRPKLCHPIAILTAICFGLGSYVASAQSADADLSKALGGTKPKLTQQY